jgi:hypothetical protein
MKKRDRRKRQTITAQAASKLSSTETSKELARPLRRYAICACGSETDFPKDDPKWPYKHKMPFWEFFESDSDKDVSFPEKKDVTGQVVDDLVTTPDFGPDTKGTIVVTLNACFQVGKKKPKVFTDPPKGHPGGQPYTESDPNLGKCDATLDRKLSVTWNCCKDDGAKQFKTKVESSPK